MFGKEGSGGWHKHLFPLHPCGRLRCSCWLLALAWPALVSHCRHVGSESANTSVLFLSLFLCHAVFQIKKWKGKSQSQQTFPEFYYPKTKGIEYILYFVSLVSDTFKTRWCTFSVNKTLVNTCPRSLREIQSAIPAKTTSLAVSLVLQLHNLQSFFQVQLSPVKWRACRYSQCPNHHLSNKKTSTILLLATKPISFQTWYLLSERFQHLYK